MVVNVRIFFNVYCLDAFKKSNGFKTVFISSRFRASGKVISDGRDFCEYVGLKVLSSIVLL